jgi:hypothetical protein
MTRPFGNPLDIEKAVLVLKKPGQPQSEESVERHRKFAERATVIESLRRIRVAKSRRHEGCAEAVKRSPIVRLSLAVTAALLHSGLAIGPLSRQPRAMHSANSCEAPVVWNPSRPGTEISVRHVHHAQGHLIERSRFRPFSPAWSRRR